MMVAAWLRLSRNRFNSLTASMRRAAASMNAWKLESQLRDDEVLAVVVVAASLLL